MRGCTQEKIERGLTRDGWATLGFAGERLQRSDQASSKRAKGALPPGLISIRARKSLRSRLRRRVTSGCLFSTSRSARRASPCPRISFRRRIGREGPPIPVCEKSRQSKRFQMSQVAPSACDVTKTLTFGGPGPDEVVAPFVGIEDLSPGDLQQARRLRRQGSGPRRSVPNLDCAPEQVVGRTALSCKRRRKSCRGNHPSSGMPGCGSISPVRPIRPTSPLPSKPAPNRMRVQRQRPGRYGRPPDEHPRCHKCGCGKNDECQTPPAIRN